MCGGAGGRCSLVMAGEEDRTWGCVGQQAVGACARDPATPRCAPGPPSTYMAPCSGAAGRAGLCQGAPLGVLAPAPALEHRWHHRPHGYRPCGSPGPTAPGPMALLAPQLPAPQLCQPWGCQPCRQRCQEGPWPWGSPLAGWGGGQWQDAMRRSYRPHVSAGQGGSWRICASHPFHPGHVSGAAHRQGMEESGSSFRLAPSPQLLFSEKKSTSWLAASKTPAFRGNTAPLYPWISWAAGKVSSISVCGNSRSAAHLLCHVTLQPRKARLWLSPAPTVLADRFGPQKGPGVPLPDF